jgi:hypothetical protein
MYDLVDRPITILSDGSRFLLWAMRAWVAVQSKGECPPAKLAPAFLKMSAIEALPHFHIAMSTLDQAGRETIHLHCPHRGQIGDDEAILLRLWSDMAAGDECAAIAVIEMLVQADAAAGYFSAVRAALSGLEAGGLSPVIPSCSGRNPPAMLNAPRRGFSARQGERRTER